MYTPVAKLIKKQAHHETISGIEKAQYYRTKHYKYIKIPLCTILQQEIWKCILMKLTNS